MPASNSRQRPHRSPRLPLPPQPRSQSGAERRVGVELEFSGLAIETVASVLRETLGGRVTAETPYEHRVVDTDLGDFKVELDYALLRKLGRRERGKDIAADLEQLSEDALAAVAKRVVPFEVVSPPVPVSRLGALEEVIARLRDAGARGTSDSPVYAFGLHLNPELPRLDAGTILAYLRAYAVLFEWLKRVSEIDFSRRVFPHIQPWPETYHRLLVTPDYNPDTAELIADYITHNPSRNRALDLLPLCAHLAPEQVTEAIDDDLVSARPTLHYRLPNCEIEQPGWGLAKAWGHWLAVERLAGDRARLDRACADYREHLDAALSGLMEDWSRHAEAWT